MLRIRNLKVDKVGKTICSVPALDVESGQRVAVIGPNGSGKTTLLRVASGLERQFEGECQWRVPDRNCVYLHQSPYLFRGSVLKNVTYGLAARRVPRREQIAVARQWLRAFGVEHLLDRQSANLSGGERRRVALARTFASQADLLLLDEPLAELDPDGVCMVAYALSKASSSTVLLSSPIPLPDAVPLNRSYRIGT